MIYPRNWRGKQKKMKVTSPIVNKNAERDQEYGKKE